MQLKIQLSPSYYLSLRSKISSRSDFICEADLFRWKTVFSGGAGGISIASQSFLLDDRSLRSGARPRIISLKNSPPDYFFTQNALSGFESHLFMHKKRIPLQVSFFVAERVGFEPTSLRGHHDFESCPLWPLRYRSILSICFLSNDNIILPIRKKVNT